jgi:hypothetical protein
MSRIVVIICLLTFCSPFLGQAQKKNPYMIDRTIKRDKRVREPWLPQNMRYARAGWFIAPGITYTMTRFDDPTETLVTDDASRIDATFKPRGRFGPYLEGGRYRIFNRGFFKYVDYGLAVKKLTGREVMEGGIYSNADNTTISEFATDGIFKETFASGFLNLNHIHTMGSFNFIQNSIGINLDYRFLQNNEITEGVRGPEYVFPGPNPLMFQLHYKLGWGIRVSKKMMVIPTVETPILNAVSFEKFKSTHGWFSSRYRPLIFSLRFLFLRDANSTECPPVFTNPHDVNPDDDHMWGN